MSQQVANTHYVARVVIERVDHMEEPPNRAVHGDTAKPAGRRVTELASFTVKSDILDKLASNVKAHLDLIDDIEAIDDHRLKNTGSNTRAQYKD